jgi:hypothetical protein
MYRAPHEVSFRSVSRSGTTTPVHPAAMSGIEPGAEHGVGLRPRWLPGLVAPRGQKIALVAAAHYLVRVMWAIVRPGTVWREQYAWAA